MENYRLCADKHGLRAETMQPTFLLRTFRAMQMDYSKVYCLLVVYLSAPSVYELDRETQ